MRRDEAVMAKTPWEILININDLFDKIYWNFFLLEFINQPIVNLHDRGVA